MKTDYPGQPSRVETGWVSMEKRELAYFFRGDDAIYLGFNFLAPIAANKSRSDAILRMVSKGYGDDILSGKRNSRSLNVCKFKETCGAQFGDDWPGLLLSESDAEKLGRILLKTSSGEQLDNSEISIIKFVIEKIQNEVIVK